MKKDLKKISTPSIEDAINGNFVNELTYKQEPILTYYQYLQDPKWQQKRLNIFNRDNWRCRCCFATNTALNAHHLYYIKGNKPWEYDDEAIVTVCNNCHEVLHKELNKLSGIIAFKILSGEITEIDFSKYFNKISHGRK